jgi:hypothetical protein
MGWLRLDDGFAMHPKVAALSDHGYRSWTKILLYCARYRTEGDVPEHAFVELGIDRKLRRTYIEVGLLDEDEDGLYSVHDWGDFNKSDPTNAERQKRWRERQKQRSRNVKRNADRNTESNDSVTGSAVTDNEPSLARAQPRAGDPSTSTSRSNAVQPFTKTPPKPSVRAEAEEEDRPQFDSDEAEPPYEPDAEPEPELEHELAADAPARWQGDLDIEHVDVNAELIRTRGASA